MAEDDHLQIFQNYEKLKKTTTTTTKTVSKRFRLKFDLK